MTRRGQQRLECPDCGMIAYATIGQLEAHGLPWCCSDHALRRFEPVSVELAEALGVTDCAAIAEYQRELASVFHGQASHYHKGRELRDPSSIAFARVEKRRHELALEKRLAALKAPSSDEPIPF